MRPALTIRPYRLPLHRAWHSARGLVTVREGWLVMASAGGQTGYGDCAPMPEAGTETAAQARQRLAFWRDAASETTPETSIDQFLGRLAPTSPPAPAATAGRPAAPAADCAVETALLDLAARLAGVPLRMLLAREAADGVTVNAMLGSASTLTPERIESAVADGYRTLKIKVGIEPIDAELIRVGEAAAALPDGIALRLDANGAWSPSEARQVIERLGNLPIESLEEPLRHPLPADLSGLQSLAPFALALDESLHAVVGASPLDPTRVPVRRLVLKPGAVGGLRATHRMARQAMAAGREVVITSLVESAAGLWATAQLAAAIGSPLAHGLATGTWLAEDLGTPPLPRTGRIALPHTAGSGFVAGGASRCRDD